ncbi:MAG: S-adenosylmethionine:tRNA ribosyltransferase-isomerase [Chitinophagaceae bacterium]|nr:S-adenosylmethionine:tRNA ribosyltransferase-isomerase [Chitinophagaceae bacterium]
MADPKNISIFDFNYELPAGRIALHPLASRDASRLLVYKNGSIREDIYKNMDVYLPAESLLIFNNTRVINARLRFQKSSGGFIEIFCLEPFEPVNEYSSVMNKKGSVRWKCMIGGAGKWKGGELEIQLATGKKQWTIKAILIEKLPDAYIVEFSWMPADLSFAEVLEQFGDIPLPPYIKRKTEKADIERYQTIYAREKGSVAAPTAGLHFTEDIFTRLSAKNIKTDFVTLHVGAGTFKPVKALTMAHHEMHAEWIDVRMDMIENLANSLDKTIVTVGTTSLRTLESLYWMGVKAILQPAIKQLYINQWEIYESPLANSNITAREALSALLKWMKVNQLQNLFTQSQILIAPGYGFKIANAIITNFHQPQSTLLLLVAAAIGNDWRKVYDHALQHDFRFLSYGDGSLLFIGQ